MPKKPIKYSLLLLLVILVSSLTGVISSVMTSTAIERYVESIAQDAQLVSISRERQRPLPGSYEQALELIESRSLPVVAGLAEKTARTDLQESWFPVQSFDALGAVITSDGWIAFHTDAVTVDTTQLQNSEVWIGQDRYAVEKVVTDSAHKLTMVKVGARDLEVATFGVSEHMVGGEYVFGSQTGRSVQVSSISNPFQPVVGAPVAAELYGQGWALGSAAVNGPLFNVAGELIALSHAGVAVPIDQQVPVIQSLLRGQAYSVVAFGARTQYVEQVNGDGAGELVVSSPTGAALAAGLQQNDVIVSIDSLLVSQRKPLASYLRDYKPGTTAKLGVLRGNDRLEVSILFQE